MHFSQRPQNLSASRAFDKRAQPLAAFDPDRDQAATPTDIRPPSTARLAAEAAFAPPQFLPPTTSQAQITVRRARLGVLAKQPAADGGMPLTGSAAKGHRVFRVDAARSAAPAAQEQSHQLKLALAANDSVNAKKTLERRVSVDKRPGPVSHVIHAAPMPRETKQAQQPLDTLIAELTSLTPVFESIKRAQAFRFIDARFAKEWQRLWQQAEEIRQELQAALG